MFVGNVARRQPADGIPLRGHTCMPAFLWGMKLDILAGALRRHATMEVISDLYIPLLALLQWFPTCYLGPLLSLPDDEMTYSPIAGCPIEQL